MKYDRQITISVGASRNSKDWRQQTLMVSELWERLKTPLRSTETLEEYLSLPKTQQDNLKDVGGYVGGTLSGRRRKASAVTGRDLLTLDLDTIPPWKTEAVCHTVASLGWAHCIYSTRKHRPEAPRLRVLIPFDRTCTADEYEPLARWAADYIGIGMADATTFEPSRLMYWPSVCSDGEYIYHATDGPALPVDTILASYDDWRDTSSWPSAAGASPLPRHAAKQGDPTEKHGIVGAFCRVYDVPAAMAKFLPGVYAETDSSDRYTFCEGSTTGGAILYDGGKFLYSHHATDPCSGKLVNAFDLVRLHKFDDLDDAAEPGTPVIRLPSYKAMCDLAQQDPKVAGLVLNERYQEATEGFTTVDDTNWRSQLTVKQSGAAEPTIDNVWLILENDPRLKGRFALNQFAGRGEVLGDLPWNPSDRRRPWEDNDNAGLYWYMEKAYGIRNNGSVDSALSLHSSRHAFNDVQGYLEGLEWDGVSRLDTLLIDYLGAEDSAYTRAVTRKAFVAAVARAMRPGTKYDQMVILNGPQGIGKSSLLDIMSRGWFNDSIRTFEGKEASELLQGVWIVEVAELDAFRRTDVSRIKQFISQRADRFRAAYGRHVKEMPRCCVFFGTTNTDEYLTDRTGNRRFWPVTVGLQTANKTVWTDLPKEVDQVWAEAVVYWRWGEPLYLEKELSTVAQEQQERHRDADITEGMIRDWLERPVPEDWNKWDLNQRRAFWNGAAAGDLTLVPRDRVCAAEVWCELFNGAPKDMRHAEAVSINDAIRTDRAWGRAEPGRFGPYGVQRGFRRDVTA